MKIIRSFEENEEEIWAGIIKEAGEFSSIKGGFDRFRKEFAPFLDEVRKWMVLIEEENGEAIGTATAWSGSWTVKEWTGFTGRSPYQNTRERDLQSRC